MADEAFVPPHDAALADKAGVPQLGMLLPAHGGLTGDDADSWDDEYDDFSDEDAYAPLPRAGGHALAAAVGERTGTINAQPSASKPVGATSSEHVLDRFSNRINLAVLDSSATSAPRFTGRDDRATVEQVLDPRTRLILFKMLNQNFISEIHGCISTGKEANVYHAFRPDGSEASIDSNDNCPASLGGILVHAPSS